MAIYLWVHNSQTELVAVQVGAISRLGNYSKSTKAKHASLFGRTAFLFIYLVVNLYATFIAGSQDTFINAPLSMQEEYYEISP